MDVKKTKEKLHKLNYKDLDMLYNMVLEEKDNRMDYMSNTTHTLQTKYAKDCKISLEKLGFMDIKLI